VIRVASQLIQSQTVTHEQPTRWATDRYVAWGSARYVSAAVSARSGSRLRCG